MKAQLTSILMVLFATVLGALGSLYLKLGSGRLTLNLKVLYNREIWYGVILYAVSSVIFIIALRGGELSVLYPFVASSYIWVCLLSVKVLKERMNVQKWAGIAFIVLGVSLIGLGS
ncbi:MAG: EamA family transporter [Candidatus Altiarchaeota archaeon]